MASESSATPDLKSEATTQRPSSFASSTSSRPQLRHNEAYSPPATNDHQPPLDTPQSSNNKDAAVPIATRFARAADAAHARSRDGEGSQSRSRSRSRGGEYEPRRSSARDIRRSSIWSQDKEKKNRSLMNKLLDHHWVPTFLK